ncbi:MAG: SRPBCC family protein [Actinobacteria bacterium]|nr:SRPBCC family protein [Actinomycetota bacterium]
MERSEAETVSVSREIAASPEEVWALVSDLTRMGEWSPEARGGRWAGGADGPSVGAVFKGSNRNGRYRWRTNVTVTECEPPRRFAFRLLVPFMGGCDWVYEIEPSDGGCRVTESWVDHRKKVLVVVGRLLSGVADRAAHNRAGMEATLDRLAEAFAA